MIESGSDSDKLSKYAAFHANWPDAIEKGLHYCRGMNFGLSELHKKYGQYEYYFMLMGDSKFDEEVKIQKLVDILDGDGRIGILSPWSPQWKGSISRGEKVVHYLVPHVSWMIRDEFVQQIIDETDPLMNYFYDGSNFRGYDADTELIYKCYQSGYCTVVTDSVVFREDHDLMADNADKIKTERQAVHRKLMYEEGLKWMKEKYGFKTKWDMRALVANEMKEYVVNHSDLLESCKLHFGKLFKQ